MVNGTITISTDAFISHLTRAKMPKAQAEAVMHAIENEAHVDVDTGELATKHDIALLRKDMDILRNETKNTNLQTQIRVIVLLGGLMAAFRFLV